MALRQASAEQRGPCGATSGTGRAGGDARFEVPRCFLSTLKAGFFSWPRARLETPLLAGHPHRGMGSRQRLWVSITGNSSAGGPSPVGTKTPSVARGSQVHVVIERRSEAVQRRPSSDALRSLRGASAATTMRERSSPGSSAQGSKLVQRTAKATSWAIKLLKEPPIVTTCMPRSCTCSASTICD